MRYYKRVDANGKTTTVESYSHDLPVQGAIEIDQAEFETFIKRLPPVIDPPFRDVMKELDELKAELKTKGYID